MLTPNRTHPAAAPLSSAPFSQLSPFNAHYPPLHHRLPLEHESHKWELTPSECSEGAQEGASLLFNMEHGLPCMQGWLAKKGGSRGVMQGAGRACAWRCWHGCQ